MARARDRCDSPCFTDAGISAYVKSLWPDIKVIGVEPEDAPTLHAALGADERTFHGLACVGDLFAALAGEGRPEMLVGKAVASGADLSTALGRAEVSVESRDVALRVSRLADRVRVEMPITETLGGLLSGEISTADAMTKLMGRRVGAE